MPNTFVCCHGSEQYSRNKLTTLHSPLNKAINPCLHMCAHFEKGAVSPAPGIEPRFRSHSRTRRRQHTVHSNETYAKAAFRSIQDETAQVNRQYSGESRIWPPLPPSPPPHLLHERTTPIYTDNTTSHGPYNPHSPHLPDTTPRDIGISVTNAQLRAAFGPSPIFQPDDPSDQQDAELEWMKGLSLGEMLRVMRGGDDNDPHHSHSTAHPLGNATSTS